MKLFSAGHLRSTMSLRRAQLERPAAPRPPFATPLTALSFEEVYEAHVDFLWRNARRLGVRADAVDDVLQQVFLVVHRRRSEVVWGGSERAWLFAILVRVVREHKRSLRRKSPHGFHDQVDPDVLPDEGARAADETIARREAAHLLEAWLEALDDDKRQVFVLADLEQMTAREISEATGTNPSTVASRLRAARIQIVDAAARHRRRQERE
jgi:RNA polymerase sigma-70 factor (ECF subfamily)